jgi:predicted RNA-binding protein YlxR (DUF448 family)
MARPGEPDGPIRTCVGCRARRPQRELLRVVRTPGGWLRVDRDAAGRGAWICGPGCLAEARRRRAFDRAWRQPVSPTAIERLERELAG